MSINVSRSPSNRDAWVGMAKFARTEEFGKVAVSREEYDEYGPERIKQWWGGNWNGATIK